MSSLYELFLILLVTILICVYGACINDTTKQKRALTAIVGLYSGYILYFLYTSLF